MGIGVDQRVTVASGGLKVQCLELVVGTDRGAGSFVASDDALLLAQAGAIPRFDAHPDAPGHQVAATGEPVGAVTVGHPDVPVQGAGVLGFEVGGAVLEPEHVSRGGLFTGGRGGAAESELGVAPVGGSEPDAGQVADRVHGDLGIIGAGLHDDVTAAAGRIESLIGKLR